MEDFDVCVIGLGAMGSSTLYQLSRMGVSCVGIDQFRPPHSRGSSHGDTRITRLVNSEGIHYAPLVKRSHQIWRDLEEESATELFEVTGGIMIGNPGVQDSWIGRVVSSAETLGVEHELLSGTQARRRWPSFMLDGDEVVLFEPGAGVLRAEKIVEAQLRAATWRGAQVKAGTRVLDVQDTGGGVRVLTDQGVVTARRAVVTAGPWASRFLPGDLAQKLKVYRQVLYWFDMDADAVPALGSLPVFIWQVGQEDHQMFYGFPALDGTRGGMKMADEQYQHTADPDDVDRTVTEADIRGMYDQHARGIRGLRRNAVRTATCLYTVVEDWDYILDTLTPNTLFASPCMGRGFKHSGGIGEALAQLAAGGRSDIDLERFSLSRFARGA